MRRTHLFLALIFAAAALLFIAGGADRAGFSGREGFEEVEAVLDGVRIDNSKGGELAWTLRTDRAVFPQGKDAAVLGQVEIDLPEKNMRVVSGSGFYDLSSGDLRLAGGVRATTDVYTITIDHAELSSSSGEMSSDASVEMRSEGLRLTGKGFRTIEREVRIIADVRAYIY